MGPKRIKPKTEWFAAPSPLNMLLAAPRCVPLALLLALLSYFRGRCRWRHGLRDVEAKRVRAASA